MVATPTCDQAISVMANPDNDQVKNNTLKVALMAVECFCSHDYGG